MYLLDFHYVGSFQREDLIYDSKSLGKSRIDVQIYLSSNAGVSFSL